MVDAIISVVVLGLLLMLLFAIPSLGFIPSCAIAFFLILFVEAAR